MTKLEQAARQALEALESAPVQYDFNSYPMLVMTPDTLQTTLTALREALAEQAECPHGVDDGACKECYMEQAEQDLDTCPGCGGVADNGHDREFPPNPYYCTKCSEQAEPL